jgi:hypothetical protein
LKVNLSNISLFTVKYDTDGKCLWTNRLGSNNSGNINLPVSTIDSYGNYYITAQISGQIAFIYDTRNINYEINIPSPSLDNTILIKYNKNGIVQWYSFVSGFSTTPNICVDNRFVRGASNNSVYLCGSYDANEGNISLYSSASEGNSPSISASLQSDINNAYLIKYNNNGELAWCSKVGGSNNNINNSIIASNDGHVYLGGEFSSASINIYQGGVLGMNPNSNIASTINNYDVEGGTFDIFLVKYNRYGTVNDGSYRFGKEIYLENNQLIPDGTEK